MRPRRPWSLHGRILSVVSVVCVLAWMAGGAAIYALLQRQDTLLFDARLENLARTLVEFAGHEIREVALEGGPRDSSVDRDEPTSARYRYQIWSHDGRLLVNSANAPHDEPLTPLGSLGWSTRIVAGQTLRIIALRDPAGMHLIQVAEPVAQRLHFSDLLSGRLVVGMGGSALALCLLTSALLRLGLRPLQPAARHLAQRGPADLSALPLDGLPAELTPVVAGINHLMSRVGAALQSERNFVAAAAHELRSPLAALRAEAQLLLRAGVSEQANRQALQSLQDGVDQAAHLVTQLLDLARTDALASDPGGLSRERRPVGLGPLFDRLLDEIGTEATQRRLRITPQFAVTAIQGSEFGLWVMLRNLLHNAVTHAREGGDVVVGTQAEGPGTLLWVEDDGPGVPADEQSRIFERFYRGQGVERQGCGLGLSIVKAVADAHGASIRLGTSTLGGLRLEVHFR
jgi:two-component system OmpR family sensor kinase/two-component system sensor histidine kinase QseC